MAHNYSQNVLFGLGYLYIQLYKPERAELFLTCLSFLNAEHKEGRILLSVSQVMQGKKISAEEFNFARRYAPPEIAQMLAKRTHALALKNMANRNIATVTLEAATSTNKINKLNKS
jgi:hypothetical protein